MNPIYIVQIPNLYHNLMDVTTGQARSKPNEYLQMLETMIDFPTSGVSNLHWGQFWQVGAYVFHLT